MPPSNSDNAFLYRIRSGFYNLSDFSKHDDHGFFLSLLPMLLPFSAQQRRLALSHIADTSISGFQL